jgi:hypothetical protein
LVAMIVDRRSWRSAIRLKSNSLPARLTLS